MIPGFGPWPAFVWFCGTGWRWQARWPRAVSPGGIAAHFEGANSRKALKLGASSRGLFISAEGGALPEIRRDVRWYGTYAG